MASEALALGELEAPVLEELWRRGELSTPEVYESIGKPRGLAYTTILTILQRLHKKGLAGRNESSRAHTYYAAISRDEFARRRGQALAASLSVLGEAGVSGFLAEVQQGDNDVLDLLRSKLATVK